MLKALIPSVCDRAKTSTSNLKERPELLEQCDSPICAESPVVWACAIEIELNARNETIQIMLQDVTSLLLHVEGKGMPSMARDEEVQRAVSNLHTTLQELRNALHYQLDINQDTDCWTNETSKSKCRRYQTLLHLFRYVIDGLLEAAESVIDELKIGLGVADDSKKWTWWTSVFKREVVLDELRTAICRIRGTLSYIYLETVSVPLLFLDYDFILENRFNVAQLQYEAMRGLATCEISSNILDSLTVNTLQKLCRIVEIVPSDPRAAGDYRLFHHLLSTAHVMTNSGTQEGSLVYTALAALLQGGIALVHPRLAEQKAASLTAQADAKALRRVTGLWRFPDMSPLFRAWEWFTVKSCKTALDLVIVSDKWSDMSSDMYDWTTKVSQTMVDTLNGAPLEKSVVVFSSGDFTPVRARLVWDRPIPRDFLPRRRHDATKTAALPIDRVWEDPVPLIPIKSNATLIETPVVVHFHGGGFLSMSPRSHEVYLREYAAEHHLPFISIDYRLSPEHQFPSGWHDCRIGYEWVCNHMNQLGISPTRVILFGDSAGGNLAAGVTLDAIENNRHIPDAVLLSYPVLDLGMIAYCSRMSALNDVLTPAAFLQICLDAYIPKDLDHESDYRMSPLRVSDKILSKMPPTLIEVGDKDPLRDEALHFARRMCALPGCGPVKVRVLGGFSHGFLSIARFLPCAQKSINHTGCLLNHLARGRLGLVFEQ